MPELSKSILRRVHDARFATRYFRGDGIDIGGAADPLAAYRDLFPLMTGLRVWERADGDAQVMAGVPDESFDFVHCAHGLESMGEPRLALAPWLRILRPGGHLVATVADEDMQGQGAVPAASGHGRKWTFTICRTAPWSPNSRNLVKLLADLGDQAEVLKVEQLDTAFLWGREGLGQKLAPAGEGAIEFVVRKRHPAEIPAGSRLPAMRRQPHPAETAPPGWQMVAKKLQRLRDTVIDSDCFLHGEGVARLVNEQCGRGDAVTVHNLNGQAVRVKTGG